METKEKTKVVLIWNDRTGKHDKFFISPALQQHCEALGRLDEYNKTLAEVGKTHVTNKFMIEKLKEQRKVDKIEVGKVIDGWFGGEEGKQQAKELKQKLGIK